MNRRGGGLWTLSGRCWFALFAAFIAVLAAWAGIDSTRQTSASAPDRSASSTQVVPDPAEAGTAAAATATSNGDTGKSSSLALVEPPLLGKTAVEVLALLHILSTDAGGGYQRTQDFGAAWMDVDGNNCDTRDDILLRDLKDTVLNGCKVMSGSFVDPYTAHSIKFTRGNDTSTFVQIDHIVSLLDAWTSGAQQLTQDQRERLANDPTNLLAVSEKPNMEKSASGAASWLPPFGGVHCEYAARQISVKYAYGLWVTQPEHDALAAVLRSCPDQAAYRSSLGAAIGPPTPEPAATPTGAVGLVGGGSKSGVYYANCSAAYAAGVSNIRRGTHSYRPELDRDGDGIACER